MDPVKNLLYLYIAIIVFNIIISLMLWRRTGEALNRTNFYFWAATLMTIVVQLIEQEELYEAVMLFSSAIVAHAMVSYMICQVADFPFPWKTTGLILLPAYLFTTLFHYLGFPFYIYSLPIVAAVSFPIVYVLTVSIIYYRSRLTYFSKALLIVMGVYQLNILNYPFFRPYPETSFIGYSVAIFSAVAFSIILYSLIQEQDVLKKSRTLEELRRTQDQLVENERKVVIGDLAAGLIHEIKNQFPFFSLLEVLIEKLPVGDSAEVKRVTGNILDGRDRMLGLLNELQSFGRDTDLKYDMEKHSLEKVVKSSIELARMDSDIKGMSIDFRSNFTGEVSVDRNKVIQVLINLLRNSAHAMEVSKEGEIGIVVDGGNGSVTISVTDNGAGIEPDRVKQIWEPFYSTKGDKGMGVGLDICRRIIERHRGTIECSSEVGRGTTMTISLPLEA